MLRRIIERKIAPGIAAAIGVVLVAPSIVSGLALDDFLHMQAARGSPQFGSFEPWDMFRFLTGDVARAMEHSEAGIMPWYGRLDARIGFFRPLSSLWHWLDYAALGLPPWLMHVESVALYAVVVLLVARLFGRVIRDPGTAGLAALIYAVDAGHGIPVGWVANRNAVLAAAFGMGALLAHERARRDAWRAGALVGPSCFALALASGESGLATLGYVLAHALTLDAAPRRERALAVAPYLAIAGAWQLIYRTQGFGVSGSGFYTDLAHSPGTFLANLLPRCAALLGGEIAVLGPELLAELPHGAPAFAIYAFFALITAAAAWALWPLIRRDRGARFFALGALFATPGLTMTYPARRLMLVAGLGVAGLLAQLVADTVRGHEPRRRARTIAWTAGLAHVTLAPLLMPVSAMTHYLLGSGIAYVSRDMPTQAELAGRTVVLVRAFDVLAQTYQFAIRGDGLPPTLRSLRLLSAPRGPATLRRIDERSVELRAEAGLFGGAWWALFRDSPMRVGESRVLSDVTVTVTDVGAYGMARAIEARFRVPLEDPSLVWLAVEGWHTVRVTPPAVGETIVLPR